jgi:hypothetical protein
MEEKESDTTKETEITQPIEAWKIDKIN